jgi:DNA modification methylase
MTNRLLWPADRVERRAIGTLLPYARNARTHSDAQVAQIAASMKEWGWTNPVLVAEDGTVIAGHGRLLAAQRLGWTEVPVMVATGWSEAQRRAYALADNKLALNAGWDAELLSSELMGLRELGVDLGLVGFSDEELAALAQPAEGLTDPDDVPEVAADAVSAPGDLWVLGRHRLICGDSTVATDVTRLLAGVSPHLMVTDPPYGVEYDAAWRNDALRAAGRAVGKVENDDRADWREAWALFPGDVAYVWHGPTHTHVVAASLEACDFELRTQIIWGKSHFVIGRGHYHPHHEPLWYAVRKGATGHWVGDRKQSTLWQIDKPRKSETGHSTQKPVECMRRPIENNSSPGQAVYEPFSGSGTTLIAAEQTGRSCYAIELNPLYVDVAVRRWQEFTGKPAVLEGNGRTFAEVESGRKETKADVAESRVG